MKTLRIIAMFSITMIAVSAMPALSASKASRISITYVLPDNPEYQQIYKGVRERRVLERLQKFLSPFQLPRTLEISIAGCDGEADAFYGDDKITICYEYIAALAKNASTMTPRASITQFDTIVGPFVDTALHEFAHALIDLLELPIFASEENVADYIGAYIYLQLGITEVRRLVSGTVYAFFSEVDGRAKRRELTEFSDDHGTPEQRAYNLLCITYGADPDQFGDIVTKGFLPKKRAEVCEYEFEQLQDAFERLIEPHIDLALADKVLDRDWIGTVSQKRKVSD